MNHKQAMNHETAFSSISPRLSIFSAATLNRQRLPNPVGDGAQIRVVQLVFDF